MIQKVEVSEDKEECVKIVQTYITDTYDLFVVTNSNQKYRVYMIDLDKSNFNEVDESED